MNRAAVCIIENLKGEILFLNRANPPLGYGFVGGKIESNESTFDGCKREIAEETGLEIKTLHYLGECKSSNGNFTMSIYYHLLDKPANIVIDPNEHHDYKWVNLNNHRLELAGNTNIIIDMFKEFESDILIWHKRGVIDERRGTKSEIPDSKLFKHAHEFGSTHAKAMEQMSRKVVLDYVKTELCKLSATQQYKEYLESEEGQTELKALANKIEIRNIQDENWNRKISSLIINLDDTQLSNLFSKFILWETKYEERYYKRGILTHSNIFNRVYDTIEEIGRDITDEINYRAFLSSAYEYRGYRFEMYCGQGSFIRIYFNDEIIFQTN